MIQIADNMVEMKPSRLALITALLSTSALFAAETLMFVGTYTRNKSKGIYTFRVKGDKLEPVGLAAELTNPSFVAIHPNRKFLYAVTEQSTGAVAAFQIDAATGKLKLINQSSTKGNGPCHLNVDKTGRNVVVANYGGGSVASIPIREDGSLGEATAFIQHEGSGANKSRQERPHAHSVNLSPDNRFLIVADLGLDKVFTYRFDAAKGTLAPNTPPFVSVAPGSGPRHFTFHPSGKFAYVVNELAMTVTGFTYDAKTGVLAQQQSVSTLPAGASGGNFSTAEIVAHPNGRFLYASNRGHDTIASFTIDKQGKLTPSGHAPTQGKIPRNFAIDPTGNLLIAGNQDSDTIVVFRIDKATGKLTPTGQILETGAPVCFRFLTLK